MREQAIFTVLWLVLYWYYAGQTGSMEKGAGKKAVGFGLTGALVMLSILLPLWLIWLLISGVILLYDLFFDAEPFRRQWWRILLPGLCLAAAAVMPPEMWFAVNGGILLVFLFLLSGKRDSLSMANGGLATGAFTLVSAFLWLLAGTGEIRVEEPLKSVLLWGGVLLEVLLFLTVEGTLYFYQKGFAFRTEEFRRELMEHSYGEIREIYMDMRGWRHDYHNHMQVMKAQLSMGNLDGVRTYLDELEQELDRVDTVVKSGNLMVDAILNSKLTLARRQKISVSCKVKVPEQIGVEDVDLCVILGNLLDNALEACVQTVETGRFLRIYMAVNGSQLYLSVQNSAREEPDFNQRNYITRKRGNHGLGMKRVQAAVDKYDGYLNLANEPGIFAAEVTMPLA
ncbi:MAG: GHKL domain-containing protein [Lachnospiraceae bacterium]|nr:GHKL domain-containing protein [Lachnospiraceae bacterium]